RSDLSRNSSLFRQISNPLSHIGLRYHRQGRRRSDWARFVVYKRRGVTAVGRESQLSASRPREDRAMTAGIITLLVFFFICGVSIVPPSGADSSALLLDVQTVAALLHCSPRHVYRLSDAGRMPAPVRLGSLVRWPRQALEDWIAAGCKPLRAV